MGHGGSAVNIQRIGEWRLIKSVQTFANGKFVWASKLWTGYV
jgi:hypothetical protein